MNRPRRQIANCLAAWGCAAVWSCSLLLVAQEPAKTPAKQPLNFRNIEVCITCHRDPNILTIALDFVDVTPAELWSDHDKHGQSFELLKGKSRERTNRILGFDLRLAFAGNDMTSLSEDANLADNVATVKSCLRCHATWPKDAVHPTGKLTQPVEPLIHGVSCQACHGPAEAWNDPHANKWWRLVSHEDKSKVGFTNVRDPVVRAQLCASCHVGNLAEEKFVKHEWYAAGHPPLPGFEYAAFAAQMPAHWKPLRAKGDFAGRTADSKPVTDDQGEWLVFRRRYAEFGIGEAELRKSYREANFPDAKDDAAFVNLPRTQEVTVSAAVVLKTFVSLAGAHAEEARRGGKRYSWPEFALYDCAACHHELRREEGLKSRPKSSGPPGRPPLPRWTSALLGLATERDANIDADLRALELAFTLRPFGDPTRIAAASKNLSDRLDKLCRELGRAPFDEERTAKSLAILLSDAGTADTRDYASARQVAWAIQGLQQDLASIPYGFRAGLNPEQQQAQDRIAVLFSRDNPDELLLTLPARKENSVIGELPKFLRAMEAYDPKWFAERLKQLKDEPPKGK